MSFEPRDYLKHMLAEAEYLTAHSVGLTLAALLLDETLQRAFVRSLEIIGEATKKVPDDFRIAHPISNGVRWPACEIGSFMITSALTSNWYGTSCATEFPN